jgi:hypothetical protein
MKTKTIAAVLTLLLASAMTASAGQAKESQVNAEQVRERLEQIKVRLELTPQQVEQIRPVLEEEVQKLKAVRDKYSGREPNVRTRLQIARELRDIQSAGDEKLQKILSKKQMEEMKKIREEFREELRERYQK